MSGYYGYRPVLEVDGTAPCRMCSDRYVGCHAECACYASWKQLHELDKAAYKRSFEGNRIDNESMARKGFFARKGQM